MNLAAEIAALNLDPAQREMFAAALVQLQTEAAEAVAQLQNTTAEAKQLRAKAKLDDLKIQTLVLELAHYKRMRFGAKSEALSPEQRDLFRDSIEEDCAAISAEVEQKSPTPRAKRERAGRQSLPEHLPRIEHLHEPESCTCGQCGGALVKIGEDISEQLDVEPATFFVHRHIRPQYACRPCERIVAAPIAPAVIDGGMAAVGLIVWILICKYVDHLPLYRIEQIAARDGVTLSRSTLADWVGRYGFALQPLVDRLAELLLERLALHADETPVQQLDPGRGKTKRAYLWAYRSTDLDDGPRIAVFDYQTGRSGAHARDFLKGWKGHLVVDDYAGYKALFTQGVIEVGCMAHARRKFFDLHAANQSPVAAEALQRIAALYEIEARGRLLNASERQTLRDVEAVPKLKAMHDWLRDTRINVADGGGLAKAIDYNLKRWPALARYANSGLLPIDNNPVENLIRPIAIGKKNWLFTGSERAGRRAAAIQSLLATAKLNGLDPAAWLKDTLEKLPTWPNSRLDELLPLGRIAE
jgi:transposase